MGIVAGVAEESPSVNGEKHPAGEWAFTTSSIAEERPLGSPSPAQARPDRRETLVWSASEGKNLLAVFRGQTVAESE